MSKKRKADEQDALPGNMLVEKQDVRKFHEVPSISRPISEIGNDQNLNNIQSREFGPITICTCSTSAEHSASALELNELRNREKALKVELSEKDEAIRCLSRALWEANYASPNKQCDGECESKDLIKDGMKYDEIEAKITEVVVRACRAEERVKEIGALLVLRDVSLRNAGVKMNEKEAELREREMRLKEMEYKFSIEIKDKEAQIAEIKLKARGDELNLSEISEKLKENEAKLNEAQVRLKKTELSLRDASKKMNEKDAELREREVRWKEMEYKFSVDIKDKEAKLTETQERAKKTEFKLTEANNRCFILERILQQSEINLKGMSMLKKKSEEEFELVLNEFEVELMNTTINAHVMECALLETKGKLVEIGTDAQKTEAKLMEAKIKTQETELKLKEADLLASKNNVNACKFKVMLDKAEARARKYEVKAHKFEMELDITKKRNRKLEAELINVETNALKMQEELTNAEMLVKAAAEKQTETEARVEHFKNKWIQAEDTVYKSGEIRKKIEERLNESENLARLLQQQLRSTRAKLFEAEAKLKDKGTKAVGEFVTSKEQQKTLAEFAQVVFTDGMKTVREYVHKNRDRDNCIVPQFRSNSEYQRSLTDFAMRSLEEAITRVTKMLQLLRSEP